MPGDDSTDATAAMPPPMIGSYRLVEPLGSGGMSSVFRAVHSETGHEVAVKVLPRYLAKNSTLLQRFLREAKSAESLEDPNIVGIYDRGSEAGRYYLVLEYVPGGDLHDRVREGGPLPILEAVDAIRQVARGLKHAASRGLIHRDIKPANILRTPDGHVKLTDLGLALQMDDEDERVTRHGTTVGTVDYMAPEQARDSRATSIRSDIYSLGCTFYYLLTGTPPFQGGDVAEKLRAHATEPAPDARQVRKETPEVLARLIRKMMAKKPEKRFPDYDTLLDVLDAVWAMLTPKPPRPEPLLALIDDEDDEPKPDEGPLLALIDDEDDDEPIAGTGPLLALIDDEDEDDEGYTLGPGPPGPGGTTLPTLASAGGGLDLSALSELSEGTPAVLPARRLPPVPSLPAAQPVAADVPGPTADEIFDIEEEIALPVHLNDLAPPPDPIDVVGWLTRVAVLGVLLMIGWIAWNWYSSRQPLGADPGAPFVPDPNKPDAGANPPPPAPVAWVEPGDEPRPEAAEPALPAAELEALGLTDAAMEVATREEGPIPVVTRIEPQSLRNALDKLTGTVEIADNGPILEEDLRVAGIYRVIRAARSYRPIVVLERSDQGSVIKRPASVVLTGQKLVIEGVHFVIDGRAISPLQQSFFLLMKGSELTLRDCTITVVGPTPTHYSVVKIGETTADSAQVSRLRVERTLIRGAASPVTLAGAGDVTLANSAVLSAGAPSVVIAGNPREKRSIDVFRSILASGGSAITLSGSAGTRDASPASVRALQSTFASIGEGDPPTLIGLRDIPAGPPRNAAPIAWKGEANRFLGWSELSSAFPGSLLLSLRKLDPATDSTSIESATRWPSTAADPWLSWPVPESASKSLASAPDRVATPPPFLREKTLGEFEPVAIAPADPAGPVTTLDFDADQPEFEGDLGRFLAERTPTKARRVRVNVTGQGSHAMTPVAMSPGVSLKIVAQDRPNAERPLGWIAHEDSTDPALISVRNASLELEGVRLGTTSKTEQMAVVSVDHGHLKLSRCLLTAPGSVGPDGGGLIRFRTEGTRGFPEDNSPRITDRPTCQVTDCVLITGGSALTAQVGRGLVVLSNCAIAAGTNALRLEPETVRRDRFGADLVLSQCTIAADRDFLSLADWPGLPPGPERPWLVRTDRCAFLDRFQRAAGLARPVLLRTEPQGISRGAIAWQSSDDVYDLLHFTALGQAPPRSARFDFEHNWLQVWNANHVLNARGPDSVRLLVGRLKPGEVVPGDLALDPTFHPGRPDLGVGADLAKMRLGITPTTSQFRKAVGP